MASPSDGRAAGVPLGEAASTVRVRAEQPLLSLKLEDGRHLTYAIYGVPLEPTPRLHLLYHHGNPSCVLEAEALHEDALRLGVSVVAMDRPGIGTSSYQKKRNLATLADDTRQLADHLAIRRFAIAGCSGGGPYATACAALLSERILALVLICPLGPVDRANADLLRSMTTLDRIQLSGSRWSVGVSWAFNKALRYMANSHPAALVKYAPEGMAAVDGELMRENEQVRVAFADCLRHAYASGARGMAKDERILAAPWNLDLGPVQCKVIIWHGSLDITVPPSHAAWYCRAFPGSELHLEAGEGHVTLIYNRAGDVLESALAAVGVKSGAHGGSSAAAAAGGDAPAADKSAVADGDADGDGPAS